MPGQRADGLVTPRNEGHLQLDGELALVSGSTPGIDHAIAAARRWRHHQEPILIGRPGESVAKSESAMVPDLGF